LAPSTSRDRCWAGAGPLEPWVERGAAYVTALLVVLALLDVLPYLDALWRGWRARRRKPAA
jgi:hypothetical protein